MSEKTIESLGVVVVSEKNPSEAANAAYYAHDLGYIFMLAAIIFFIKILVKKKTPRHLTEEGRKVKNQMAASGIALSILLFIVGFILTTAITTPQ